MKEPLYPTTKCKHCGKDKGNHKAKTLECPTGKPSRIGYTSYSSTNKFTPLLSNKPRIDSFKL